MSDTVKAALVAELMLWHPWDQSELEDTWRERLEDEADDLTAAILASPADVLAVLAESPCPNPECRDGFMEAAPTVRVEGEALMQFRCPNCHGSGVLGWAGIRRLVDEMKAE